MNWKEREEDEKNDSNNGGLLRVNYRKIEKNRIRKGEMVKAA